MPLDHEIYTKCKKETLSNLIKVISSYNTAMELTVKKQKKNKQKKNNKIVIQYKKLMLFLIIPLFHFIKSIFTVQFHLCS